MVVCRKSYCAGGRGDGAVSANSQLGFIGKPGNELAGGWLITDSRLLGLLDGI